MGEQRGGFGAFVKFYLLSCQNLQKIKICDDIGSIKEE
jgi:hypothetical protein